MKVLSLIGKIFLFLLLTFLTQIGGIIWLISLAGAGIIDKKITGRMSGALAKLSAFLLLYLICVFLIVPLLARPFGRVPLSITTYHNLKPLTVWTCLLNRNYVRSDLKNVAEQVATEMNQKFPGTVTHYLDANFPFINKFPLPPHLSHNDGKKLDLAFCYLGSGAGNQTNDVPSPIGYGISEEPRPGEIDQPCICRQQGYWQYGFMRKIMPQGNRNNFLLDSVRTKEMVILFAANDKVGKIFIEPHLKVRLGLAGLDKIRYHGCRAVRHDDHIHVQLK
jgi:hypothetical protein